MILPSQYAWFEPVLVASVVVFVINLVGASIAFGNRFLSALFGAVLFGVVFGALVYSGYGNVSMTLNSVPNATAPDQVQINPTGK